MNGAIAIDGRFAFVAGRKLAARRVSLFLTQKALAKSADLHLRAIAKIEASEKCRVRISTIPKLANALGVPIDVFSRDFVADSSNAAATENTNAGEPPPLVGFHSM